MLFLGEGSEGCVIKNRNFVSKYSIFEDLLINEYNNIKLLPKNDMKNDFYVNPDDIYLSEVLSDGEKKRVMSMCDNLRNNNKNNKRLFKLDMPLIKGISINNYLKYNLNTEQYIKLIYAFLIFIQNIKEFNRNGYYHNDLHTGNMIYNINKEKIMIVDFSSLSINENNSKYSKENTDDLILLYEYLEDIILRSISNIQIREYFTENNIIDETCTLNYEGDKLFNKIWNLFMN
jgi:serine/threonine protein kinase